MAGLLVKHSLREGMRIAVLLNLVNLEACRKVAVDLPRVEGHARLRTI